MTTDIRAALERLLQHIDDPIRTPFTRDQAIANARAALATTPTPAPPDTARIESLRTALREVIDACGGLATADVSDEFLCLAPGEVRSQLAKTLQGTPPAPTPEAPPEPGQGAATLTALLHPAYEPGDGSADGAQLVDGDWWHPIMGCDSLQGVADNARAILARAQAAVEPVTQPTPAGVTDADIEEAAAIIYESMRFGAGPLSTPPWMENGNSLMQDEARRSARAILCRYARPTLAPVAQPVPKVPTEQEVSEWINTLPLWHGATRDELTGIVLRAFSRWGCPAVAVVVQPEPGDLTDEELWQIWNTVDAAIPTILRAAIAADRARYARPTAAPVPVSEPAAAAGEGRGDG